VGGLAALAIAPLQNMATDPEAPLPEPDDSSDEEKATPPPPPAGGKATAFDPAAILQAMVELQEATTLPNGSQLISDDQVQRSLTLSSALDTELHP
jgi:hypothetical protein